MRERERAGAKERANGSKRERERERESNKDTRRYAYIAAYIHIESVLKSSVIREGGFYQLDFCDVPYVFREEWHLRPPHVAFCSALC